MNNILNFGKKLIEVRKAKGLTQDEVAEMYKITTRTIQRIESGDVAPRAFTIKTISEALEFDFLEALNTGYMVNKENRYSKLKWHIKDLFNLKTNGMKKVSILTISCLVIGFALFAFISETSAQPQKRSNYINTEELVEVAFTNAFTIDSLMDIKNDLVKRGIILNYKKLEFDETNHLLLINCEVVCPDGFKGSFEIGMLNSKEIMTRRFGFYRNYSKKVKSPFGTGCIDEME